VLSLSNHAFATVLNLPAQNANRVQKVVIAYTVISKDQNVYLQRQYTFLWDVSEGWVMMPKIPLLVLVESLQSMVSLSSCSDPILSHVVENTKS